jgi:hypothetical protein
MLNWTGVGAWGAAVPEGESGAGTCFGDGSGAGAIFDAAEVGAAVAGGAGWCTTVGWVFVGDGQIILRIPPIATIKVAIDVKITATFGFVSYGGLLGTAGSPEDAMMDLPQRS